MKAGWSAVRPPTRTAPPRKNLAGLPLPDVVRHGRPQRHTARSAGGTPDDAVAKMIYPMRTMSLALSVVPAAKLAISVAAPAPDPSASHQSFAASVS